LAAGIAHTLEAMEAGLATALLEKLDGRPNGRSGRQAGGRAAHTVI